jgi:hypothetical protein
MSFISYSSIPEGVAIPYVNRLFASFLLRRFGFFPCEVHVRFMVDKVVLGQVISRALRFYPVKYNSTKSPCLLSFHPGDRQ